MPRLIDRLRAETESTSADDRDPRYLHGFFTRFRPHGVGLERVLNVDGVQGEVLERLLRLFAAAAPGWHPEDLYFLVRKVEPLDLDTATAVASRYLHELAALARYADDPELAAGLVGRRIVAAGPTEQSAHDDLSTASYECVCDFLADLQPDRCEVFLLKEAVYSMASDYFLTAYVLWPAIKACVGRGGSACSDRFL